MNIQSMMCVIATLTTIACVRSGDAKLKQGAPTVQNRTAAQARSGIVQGISRATPYQHEQGGSGTCGAFAAYGPATKWAAFSEKLIKEKFANFGGCIGGSSTQAPNCQTPALDAGICGAPVWVRCTDGSHCSDQGWKEVRLVDVCPASRAYHDHVDHDSKGDTACASSYVADLDVSILKEMCKDKAPGDAPYGCKDNVKLEISATRPY